MFVFPWINYLYSATSPRNLTNALHTLSGLYRLYKDCTGISCTKEEGKITANLSNSCQTCNYKPPETPLNKNCMKNFAL